MSYAFAFPRGCLCLVDTYDTLKSGVPNFLAVAVTLHKLGYKAVGIRLDSGDLAYLSKAARRMFVQLADKLGQDYDYFKKFNIVASNDINEHTLLSLNQQGHEIDTFGIGTNLVTCQAQPALGCVFKLVEVASHPRIKLSNEIAKMTIPGRKNAYRLYGSKNNPLVDLMSLASSEVPQVGVRLLCSSPHDETKRAFVVPQKVEPLLHLAWDGKLTAPLPTLEEAKQYCKDQVGAELACASLYVLFIRLQTHTHTHTPPSWACSEKITSGPSTPHHTR